MGAVSLLFSLEEGHEDTQKVNVFISLDPKQDLDRHNSYIGRASFSEL